MKGTVILSETILETTAILISFILIVLVVQLVFSQQNQRTFESVFESLGREVSTSIDRAAATAGNILMQVDIPKGLKFNLNIDQKALIIKYGEKNSVRTFFSSQIKSGPYSFQDPKNLCIIKTVNDNSVYITNKTCSCKTNDKICDPECNVENKCDPKCINDNTTGVCNPYCAKDNPSVCDRNCYKSYQTGVCEKNCIKENERDGICSPDCEGLKKGVCDLDCYDQNSNGKTGYCDPDCPSKGQIIENDGIKYKQSDGNCYTGCINTTATTKLRTRLLSDGVCDSDCKDSQSICDPDCPDSPACQNICIKEDKKASEYQCCEGLVACPNDGVCRKDCCGNSVCEGRPDTVNGWPPGNKTRWETFYTCPQDCNVDPQTKLSSCQSSSFTKSVCYTNVYDSQGRFTGFSPVWRDKIFDACNDEVKKFLDRRNWDIKELIKTWIDDTPEGWAWDNSRYEDACNRMVGSSTTILSNEKYTSSVYKCCGIQGSSCDADSVYLPECSGVGFCIDHATAVVSVLRTLGVPAKNVYAVFDLSPSRAHAWVLLKCDPNEPENRRPLECAGNDGKWLSVDATAHYVAPLSTDQYMTICLMWNDQGLYAQTEGKIDATKGYAYDPSIPRSYGSDPSICLFDQLCKKTFGVECVVP